MRIKKGFTLIELIIVIAIIAILSVILIPIITNSTQKAKISQIEKNAESISFDFTNALTSHFCDTCSKSNTVHALEDCITDVMSLNGIVLKDINDYPLIGDIISDKEYYLYYSSDEIRYMVYKDNDLVILCNYKTGKNIFTEDGTMPIS